MQLLLVIYSPPGINLHSRVSLSQLILFIAEHLECNKEDCEALIHMLNTFLKQLHLDREVVITGPSFRRFF